MRYIFFLTLISLIMFHCNAQKNEKIILVKNFSDEDVIVNQIFVADQDNIMLCTEKINYDKLSDSNLAIITKTNSSGNASETQTIGLGHITDIKSINDKFFVITNVSSKEAYALTDSSVLYLSTNKGNEWNKIFVFPFLVTRIFLIDNNHYYAVCRDQRRSDNWFFMYTENGGYSWTKIFEKVDLHLIVFERPFGDNNSFYFLTVEDGGKCELLKIKNQIINTLQFTLPNNFTVYSITRGIDLNDFFIIGTQDNNMLLYAFDGEKVKLVSKIHTDYSPDVKFDAISVYKGTINLITSKISGFGTKPKILRSTDSGATWKDIQIAIDDRFSPYTFYKGKVYGYSGVARIQVVE